MSVNYELLRTFVAAATAPTFASAAARRHVSPSAISQQVRALEVQLGVALFERLGRRARLTEGGRALLAGLGEPLAAVERALGDAGTPGGSVRGNIAIGAPAPFARVWLRPRLQALLQAHPQLVLDVSFGVPSLLARALLDGQLDLALLATTALHPGLESAPVFTETFVAVASPALFARAGRPRGAAELRRQRHIVFDGDLAMLRPWWRAAFGPREPLPEDIAARVGNLDEMLALAVAGFGVTVLPDYFVAESLQRKDLIALSPHTPGRAPRTARNPIYLAWRKGTPPSARFTAARAALAGKAR